MEHIQKLKLYLNTVGTKVRYKGYWFKVVDILTILICGALCGLKELKEIHQYAKSKPTRKMLMKYFNIIRIPCYSQFTVILGIVEEEHINDAFRAWCKWIMNDIKEVMTVALDGKTIRSTEKMKSYESPLHIVNAYITELGITIGQLAVKSKSNEIPAVQELIEILDVNGMVVIADALNCQTKTADKIIKNGGEYILSVKKNQENLYTDIAEIFDYIKNDKVEQNQHEFNVAQVKKTEKNRGRIETREANILTEIDWLEGKENWNNLTAIGMITKKQEENGIKSEEKRYYIMSKEFTPEELLKYTRNEWGVESLHWLLDVHFNEDKCKVINIGVQKSLNIIRKIALNLLTQYKVNNDITLPISNIMRNCLFDTEELISLMANLKYINC